MTEEVINEYLTQYKTMVGRCGHLRVAIPLLENELNRISHQAAADLATRGGSQNLDGMPHGTTVGNPTEKLGLLLASGYREDEMDKLQVQIWELERELSTKSAAIKMVDAWMSGLPSRQRWMIERQCFDALTYAQIIPLYKIQFGDECSKDTLKRIRDRALKRIYEMAI